MKAFAISADHTLYCYAYPESPTTLPDSHELPLTIR